MAYLGLHVLDARPRLFLGQFPRRIRAFLGGELVVDTVRALYVWEWANYPQYYIPVEDVRTGALVDEGHVQQTRRGPVRVAERPPPGRLIAHRGAALLVEAILEAVPALLSGEQVPLNDVTKQLRDAKVLQIVEGTSEIQRLIIARSLLKRGLEATAGNN